MSPPALCIAPHALLSLAWQALLTSEEMSEESGVPDEEALNMMIARGDEELAIFNDMDLKRRCTCIQPVACSFCSAVVTTEAVILALVQPVRR